MAKNNFRKILACCVVFGAAVAAGIVYFTKYKDFQKSLDEDFDDFEDDFNENLTKHEEKTESPLKREYVSIPLEPSASQPFVDNTFEK